MKDNEGGTDPSKTKDVLGISCVWLGAALGFWMLETA